MAMYATPSELAGYLQQDLDTYTATQALTLASAEFSAAADTAFAATTVTWSTTTFYGCGSIELPYNPVTAVSAVRVNGSAVTGVTLRGNTIYRTAGFGYRYSWPPDQVDVDLTYGYTTVPDEVKLAVLEIAAGLYANPVGVASEGVDDVTTRYNGVPLTPGRPWPEVARSYHRLLIA